MILTEAISTARGAAVRFAKPFVVYRLPAWPVQVYGVIAVDRGLPDEAEIIERLEPFEAPRHAPDEQGSLF